MSALLARSILWQPPRPVNGHLALMNADELPRGGDEGVRRPAVWSPCKHGAGKATCLIEMVA